MGYFAYLEVDSGDMLSIKEKGVNFGTPLVAFLAPYSMIIGDIKNSPERRWFTHLEEQSSENIRLLSHIYYGEDLRYSSEEYNRFIKEWGSIIGKINEVDFKKRVEQREKMWTSIDNLLNVIVEIIRILPEMGEDTYWYTSADTIPAFVGLLKVLKQAQDKGGKRARILIL